MNQLKLLGVIVMALASFPAAHTYAQKEKTVMVGGAAMYPSKNIVENAVNSKDHTTLVAAVKAAGLVETLSGPGPFTVFAPTNAAFNKLPKAAVDKLMMPESKAMLANVLTYHVIAGKLDSKDLMMKIKAGKGKAVIKTVQGENLTFMQKGNELWLMDSKGNKALVTIKDVYQSNGVIHVINTVLMP
ncbi:fasciclin domain-containing protein [Taibaiella lutea]|uniref:Fasciclin domain-containing protein n=2 Tax=Taibaiella lutea TaxID=2608001 RepID=A0A5M6CJK8_9BACT|nr:fasciclin domain-containing protein [Taibaiella lutea]